MTGNQIFQSVTDEAQYIKEGYVKKRLFTSQQVTEILQQLLALKPDDNFAPQRAGSSNYHCTFLDTNAEYKRAANALFKYYFNPLINELFYDYQLWNANLYVKPPGAGKFEIHQNWTHVVDEKYTTFTIWCPLVDTTAENGTICLVKGSHKIVPDIATMDVPYYFHDFEKELVEKYLEPMACEAGECLIFEDGLIHFSDINKTGAPRYALQVLIGPKSIRPVYFYFDKNNPEKGFEVFEIDESFFLNSSYLTFKNRPSAHKSIGFIPNNNKLITEEKFIEALEKGDERRKRIYGDV